MTDETQEHRPSPAATEHWKLLFGVRRSVRYHRRRERFLDSAHNLGALATALAGSATVVTLLAELGPRVVLVAAALTAVAGAIELVFGLAKGARLHSELARDFIGLEQNLVRAGPGLSTGALNRFQARRLEIEEREPPALRVLDTLCHNELLRALGYPKEQQVHVGFLQRRLANFVDFGEHRLHSR